MTVVPPAERTAEPRREPTDAQDILRAALERGLEATSATRGLVALADLATGRVYAVQGIGITTVELDAQRPVPLGGPRHPIAQALRDGELREFGPRELARATHAAVRRLGLRAAVVVPLPLEVTVSPCFAAGRCLSTECPVGERTSSTSPDDEWLRRVASSCVRARALRAPAALVLDTHGVTDEARAALRDIADGAARSLSRVPALEMVGGAPAGEGDEEWRRRAFAAVDEPVLVADGQGNLRFTNAPAHRLFVASPADSEGRRRAVEFNRMLLSAWLTSYARTPEPARPRELALVEPEDGSELLFELITSPAVNSVSRETGTVVVLKDVSDLRHAAEELEGSLRRLESNAESARREGEQLRLVLERIDQAIVVADPRTGGEGGLASGGADVLRMNHAARRLLEATPEDPQRRREIVQRNDAIVTSFLTQVDIGGADAAMELTLIDPFTERPRAFAAHAGLARDQVGAAVAIVCVLADLTEIRELERRRVERQLFESEKLAATGRLAASFAHEINNPLEAMKNSLYLVASELPEDAPSRRFIDIARRETDRISRIVRQILGFYRPSASRAAVDLNALAGEVTELLGVQLRKARVTCELRLDPYLPHVVAAGDQLRQVLLNLVINGVQALTSGGRIRITTRIAPPAESGRARAVVGADSVVIEVSDDGPGVAPEVLPRLFEPFVTTKERAGTGLGLWVCHEIVQAHGGTITVESTPGRGTTFVIVLPIRPREAEA